MSRRSQPKNHPLILVGYVALALGGCTDPSSASPSVETSSNHDNSATATPTSASQPGTSVSDSATQADANSTAAEPTSAPQDPLSSTPTAVDSDSSEPTDLSSIEEPARAVVTPVVSGVWDEGEQLLVQAYIPGLVEDGGQCTATVTFANGSFAASGSSSATGDAAATWCDQMSIELADSPALSVVVQYTSKTRTGQSQPWEIQS